MKPLTMEADIDHGRIIPKEPEKLPNTGRALITVLDPESKKPGWDAVVKLLGKMESKVDGANTNAKRAPSGTNANASSGKTGKNADALAV